MPDDRTGVRILRGRPETPARESCAPAKGRDRRAEVARERIEALSRVLGTPADLLIADVVMPASLAGGTEVRVLARRAPAEGRRSPAIAAAIAAAPEPRSAAQRPDAPSRIVASLLTALEAKDPCLPDHGARVAVLARRVGLALGLSPHDLSLLELAGLVHDLGKIGVPEAILQKPGPLTPEEFRHIRLHPGCSARILRPLEEFRGCLQYVYHHHERFDGTGYPDGLSGTRIPIGARILSVCDAADAMSTDRPYRAALDERRIRQDLLEGRGTQFDGDVVDVLVSLFYR